MKSETIIPLPFPLGRMGCFHCFYRVRMVVLEVALRKKRGATHHSLLLTSFPQPARLLVLLCATDQMRYKPNLMALAVICVIPYITIRTAEGSPIRDYRVISHDRVVIGMCLRIIVIG
jgi:hypothetical protein